MSPATLTALAFLAAPPAAAPADAFGDPLPPGAVARMGTARLRHGELVAAVAYDPKGRFVAAASQDGTVRLWDAATGKELARLRGHTGTVRGLALSADGRTLAGTQDGGVLLWDVQAAAAAPRVLKGHDGAVMSAAFAPGGASLVTGGFDGTLRVWGVKSGDQLRSFGADKGQVWSLALSPDGKTLASTHVSGPFGKATSSIHLWDFPAGTNGRRLAGPEKTIYRLAFSPDGKAVAAGGDDGARAWDVATGRALVKPDRNGTYTPCVTFSPGGKTLLVGGAGFLRELSLAGGREVRAFDVDPVVYTYAAAYSPDGKTLATGTTRAVGLWDAATAKPLHPSSGHAGEVQAALFTPDGKGLLTGGYGRSILRWDAATGRRTGRVDGPRPGWNGTLALSPDGKTLAALGHDMAVVLLDAATGARRVTFTKHLPPRMSAMTGMSVAFAPDGQTVFSAAEGIDPHIRRWDAGTGAEVLKIPTGKGGTTGLAVSPDGRTLYSASRVGPIRVWGAASGEVLRFFGAGATRLTLSADGRRLATAQPDGVLVWDAAAGRELYRLPPLKGYSSCLAFSPDGRTLAAVGDDERVRFYELATGRLRLELAAPVEKGKAIAFSPDGRLFATGGSDGTTLLWDFRSLPLLGGAPGDLIAALAGTDAVAAFRAVCALAGSPGRGVPMLARLLGRADAKAVAALIARLDDDRAEVRREAMRELAALGSAAAEALQKVVDSAPDPDVRLRAAVVLREMAVGPEGRRLRGLRALEALEAAGTPEARGVIEGLAKGDGGAELTREAQAALARLGRPAVKRPGGRLFSPPRGACAS